MDDKNLNFQTYQDLQTIFAAKRKKSKTKTMPVESSPFLQACSHLYQTGPKLFTENNYELLKQYPRLSEEILAHVRPSQIQALFGNYQDSDEIVYNRIYILSVLHSLKRFTQKPGYKPRLAVNGWRTRSLQVYKKQTQARMQRKLCCKDI